MGCEDGGRMELTKAMTNCTFWHQWCESFGLCYVVCVISTNKYEYKFSAQHHNMKRIWMSRFPLLLSFLVC